VILAFALAAAVLFGCGAYLLLKRDLVRVVAGIMLISQCAMVTLIGSSFTRGAAAIRVDQGEVVSDSKQLARGQRGGIFTVSISTRPWRCPWRRRYQCALPRLSPRRVVLPVDLQ
jgi:hypothetical protein